MILTTFPRLFRKAIAHRDWDLLALTLDLAVPPLSLLALVVTGMFTVAAISAVLSFSASALAASTASLLAFVSAACLAWKKCGCDLVPVSAVLSIPLYILGKLGLYRVKLFNKTDAQWIRTDRTKSE